MNLFLRFPLLPSAVVPFFAVLGAGYLSSRNLLVGTVCGAVAAGVCFLFVVFVRARVREEEEHLLLTTREVADALSSAGVKTPRSATVVQTLQAVKAHLESQQRRLDTLDGALEGMADGVWLTDAEGTIVLGNEALRTMLSFEGPLVGQRPLAVLRSAELQQAISGATLEGRVSELTVPTEHRILAIRVVPLKRGLEGAVAVFHDVTTLKGLEKVRRDFVANVSHELGTPLTAIRGYAETLKAGAWSDPAHAPRMVEIIYQQAERLSGLVRDLLELSRLESRSVEMNLAEVALKPLVERAWEVVSASARNKALSFRLDVPSELRATLDKSGMEQVLLNLLDNAVKYTPEQGHIRVAGRKEGAKVVLEITDTGIGIEAAHLPRIFERFYRVDAGRSREMGGTGLGLSIVKHLLTSMQAEIRVLSEPRKGSTFQLLLPSSSFEPASLR